MSTCIAKELEVTCQNQTVTVKHINSSDSSVVSEQTFFRGTLELIEDPENGIVTLYSATAVPGTKGNGHPGFNPTRYSVYAEKGTVAVSDGCETVTASVEYTELLNKLKTCATGCCGGYPVISTTEIEFNDGEEDTAYTDTVAGEDDYCPDDNLTYQRDTSYTQVGGTAAVSANSGAFTFTPTSGFTGDASFGFQMLCNDLVVGHGVVTITFS